VVTVSRFAADELRDVLGVEAVVVPGGVDERFGPDAPRPPGLERPYVLCVGGESARKNFGALATVARALAPRGVDMVVAGSRRSHHGALSHPAGVRELGYVDDALLPGLYAGAEAFVLPSRHEGFGLPCLEAMACGTPVVATRAGALPETCGDAALLVDPGDDAALADAVLAGLGDTRLAAAGRAHAARFSWDRTVAEIDALLAAEAHTL
jgi:glycosyltransferase involved in cell wall biosynthesis